MKLFILRHGRAEAHRSDDASRELIPSGQADVRAVVTANADYLSDIPIWSSPYVRARQTAAIAAEVLGRPTEPDFVTDKLVPSASSRAITEEIYRASLPALLLVSHQPLVSDLLDYLCGRSEHHHMKTASLACVELEVAAADMGQLAWLVHPGEQ